MPKQYAMIIDLNRCVGCHACAIACRAEWDVPVPNQRNWVKRLGPAQTSKGLSYTYYPGLCNHCKDPACVKVCPADVRSMTFTDKETGKTVTQEVAATWKDPFTGAVLIDKNHCIGCGMCVEACPYGARYLNEKLEKADKCTFCVERLEKGLEPACVQTCLAKARIFGDMNDSNSEVAQYIKKGAKGITSAAVNIGPNVYYYGKERDIELLFNKCAPQKMPQASVGERRNLLARMIKGVLPIA
ncbi:MAG: 4Fe-4S dicluster domain-containing protein [Deltaproteobacteria bacterium]|nr:4Fe-4S dicluster domain-containing protein [Deltaproteobacteria bacterium]